MGSLKLPHFPGYFLLSIVPIRISGSWCMTLISTLVQFNHVSLGKWPFRGAKCLLKWFKSSTFPSSLAKPPAELRMTL